MPGRLIVVTGTGTGIGKTHFAEAFLLALQTEVARVVGLKPVESGVDDPEVSDGARLRRASTFHVKHTGLVLREPISPHLAARLQGVRLELARLADPVRDARRDADAVIVELPGGLFTPLAPGVTNANLAARMDPDAVLLVAPDRLGVLHDTTAAVLAAGTVPLPLAGIVLVAPEYPDASTGTNGAELATLVAPPILAILPRGTPAQLATALRPLARRLAAPPSA